jgi:hypothetical protein
MKIIATVVLFLSLATASFSQTLQDVARLNQCELQAIANAQLAVDQANWNLERVKATIASNHGHSGVLYNPSYKFEGDFILFYSNTVIWSGSTIVTPVDRNSTLIAVPQ